MCGIAGLFDPTRTTTADELHAVAARMGATLLHRGPDDGGTWAEASSGIALASRRLAVIDLSAEGHQPMLSASGRFVIAYNGEIYNFAELRQQLASRGASFRGGSDTEVLLAACEAWGLEATLRGLNGMFAFALFDRSEQVLSLARDRLGEKPLYYGFSGSTLVFGSELKALLAVPGCSPEIDRTALARYFQLSRVPAPHSIYEGVSKLEPGSLVTVTRDSCARREVVAQRYWSAFEVAGRASLDTVSSSPEAAVDELEHLLGDAVQMRLHADVPVGVFLSGGVDSSTIAALMRARSAGSVRSFTIGFEDAAYDESADAAAVARHLGTEHVEHRLGTREAMEVIPRLPVIYDEPFADPSEIPTYLVSTIAREHVTVALSGDGGDELFGGYNRHTLGGPIFSVTRRVPRPVRLAGARLLTARSPASWDRLFARAGAFLPRRATPRLLGLELHKLASILPAESAQQLYEALASTWPDPGSVVLGERRPADVLPAVMPAGVSDLAARMMYLDLVSYLPDDILVKLDRASMAVSLESRVPLLDHRVVELAWRLPSALKIRNGTGKWILRRLLERHVPAALVDRPKAGFGLPVGSWLRGPLRGWAEELLSPRRLAGEGYLVTETVRRCWDEHSSGRYDRTDQLWSVLMFQSWLERYRR